MPDKRLDELLWAKDQVKALSQSIKQNGGVYDPIIVQKLDGRYLVREGNSRTVATRHLSEQHPNDERFFAIPAMVFDEALNDDDLAVLLADMHVAGKIRWDAYEQAKHVATLYEVHGKTYDWLANHLRLSKSRSPGNSRRTSGRRTISKEGPTSATWTGSVFSRRSPRRRTSPSGTRMTSNSNKTSSSGSRMDGSTDPRQVRDLNSILANNQAAEILAEQGYAAAAAVLIREDPSLGSDIYDAVKRATDRLAKAPADEIHDLGTNERKLLMLRNLRRAIDDLATLAEVEL